MILSTYYSSSYQLLLEGGADPFLLDSQFMSAREMATNIGHHEIAALLKTWEDLTSSSMSMHPPDDSYEETWQEMSA